MKFNPTPRLFGFWMCCALVVGNMIGSGIFMLPVALAPYGLNSVLAWLFTASGAVTLAVVFARLSRAFPRSGGPYAYTHAAFGAFPAFLVAWGYWISIWVGNAAIATGAVSYLTPLFPWVGNAPGRSATVTLIVLWMLTLVNCYGVRAVGWVQNLTTLMKLVPLLAVAGLGIWFVRGTQLAAAVPLSIGGTTAAATLTLWALLGLESATVPADRVQDPARTIPRATMVGTITTSVICLAACSVVLLLLPAEQLASSNAPFADVARRLWGERPAQFVAVFAAVSGFGALNGWILLQAELPRAMAIAGVFPRIFARESPRQTPTFALIFTSVLVSILVIMNFQTSMARIFTFMILLSTTACLIMYLLCSLALLTLMWKGRLEGARRGTASLAVVGVAATLYSLWTIVGAGREAALWAAVLLVLGVPVFALSRGSAVTLKA